MEKVTQTEYFTLSYQKPILSVRWTRPVAAQEFRRGYLRLFIEAKKRQAKSWLIDLRQRGEQDMEESYWLSQELFPRMLRDLGDCNCLSYVVTPEHYAKLLSVNEGSPVVSYSSVVHIRMFVCENEAQQWLHAELRQAG